MMRKIRVLLLLGSFAFAFPAYAGIVFDNSSRMDFQSIRNAEDSPLAIITVSAPTLIDQIGAMVDLSTDGNLEFLIFDFPTSTLLFNSGPVAFADTGLNFHLSPVFASFLLNPGTTYAIGAIADVAGFWGTNNASSGSPFTQNGITASDDLNANVVNFASPTLAAPGTAMIILELGAPSPVPEPSSVPLVAAGVALLVALRSSARARIGVSMA
jgi:hypothetical protein